jgi:hypothetical protein
MAELMQQYARDFNCLSDQDRKTRQRALQKLGALARSPQPDVDAAWEQALRVPLLKLFSDTVEKNRELAIGLATELVPVLSPDMLRSSLPYLMPVLVGRLATNPIAEDGEELRLQLLQLLQLVLKQGGGSPLAPHLPELVQALASAPSASIARRPPPAPPPPPPPPPAPPPVHPPPPPPPPAASPLHRCSRPRTPTPSPTPRRRRAG